MFKKGINTYKKYKKKEYDFIVKHIDLERFLYSIAKIESNFKPKKISFDGYNTSGFFHLLNSVLENTILSYSKKTKLKKLKELYYNNVNSQVFVMIQLIYNNLKELEKHNFKLFKGYELALLSLESKNKIAYQLAILHNAGYTAFKRFAINYSVLIMYLPNFVVMYSIFRKYTEDYFINKLSIIKHVDYSFKKYLNEEKKRTGMTEYQYQAYQNLRFIKNLNKSCNNKKKCFDINKKRYLLLFPVKKNKVETKVETITPTTKSEDTKSEDTKSEEITTKYKNYIIPIAIAIAIAILS